MYKVTFNSCCESTSYILVSGKELNMEAVKVFFNKYNELNICNREPKIVIDHATPGEEKTLKKIVF